VWTNLWGTVYLGLLDRMMVAYGVVLSHGGIVFGADAGWRGSEADRFASTSSTMGKLCGVESAYALMCCFGN
jgi:hypothetical protein